MLRGSNVCSIPASAGTATYSRRLISATRAAHRESCPVLRVGPVPYSTAGILLARRIRRAAPLPNSVRGSATMRTSDTAELLRRQVSTVLSGFPLTGQLTSLRCAVVTAQSLSVPSWTLTLEAQAAELADYPRDAMAGCATAT
jgi:hypothetical protein